MRVDFAGNQDQSSSAFGHESNPSIAAFTIKSGQSAELANRGGLIRLHRSRWPLLAQ